MQDFTHELDKEMAKKIDWDKSTRNQKANSRGTEYGFTEFPPTGSKADQFRKHGKKTKKKKKGQGSQIPATKPTAAEKPSEKIIIRKAKKQNNGSLKTTQHGEPIRLYQLAKELNLPNNKIIAVAKEIGLPGPISNSTKLSGEQSDRIRYLYLQLRHLLPS